MTLKDGIKSAIGKYNMYCVDDYPALIKGYETTPSAYVTPILTVSKAEGGYTARTYCDGGAQTLAIAIMAFATASISIY